MIEILDYALQFVIFLLCGIYASACAARTREKGWLQLAFFYECYALADLYWLLCVVLIGETPKISYISDLSWYVGYIFLVLLLRQILGDPPHSRRSLAWLAPLFTAGACLFFFQWGDYFGNVVTAALMGWLGYLIMTGLLDGRAAPEVRRLCLVCAAFFMSEYAMWVASCYWMGNTLRNPYFWFDGTLTLSCTLLIPTYRKAVAA